MFRVGENTVRNALLVFAVLFIIAVVGSMTTVFHTSTYTNCQVTGKDRTSDRNGNSQMRVYSSCGTFEVADSLVMMRWNSADVYGKIEVNKTYNFTSRGYRIPFISSFPNIDTIKEITN